MSAEILKAIGKLDVYLSIITIIIDSKLIGNEGMHIICSQELSHVTKLRLGKTIEIKKTT
jgi:hypothetical protein